MTCGGLEKTVATPSEAERPNLPWQTVEERIKGLKEADVLEKLCYMSLGNSSADSVLWEGPEELPNSQNQ